LFALPVLLAGLAAHRAWALGRGWTWFWLAAAAATLVKGPLGLLLGGAGLVAVFWEWKSGGLRRPQGNHLAGIALYLLICGGWFGLAYLQAGQAVIDKMIFRELVGHSIASKEGGGDIEFYKPVFYLLSKFLPWSLLSAMAFWRIWKAPSGDADLRRFERFLVCWIIVGLVVFSLSSHQRTRLILPIVPPMAILAGHELARRISGWRPVTIRNSLAALTVASLACFALHRHVLMARERNVQETLSVYEMADSIKARVGAAFPLTYLHNSVAMQFCMDSYKPFVSDDDAAKLLRGDAAAFVLVQDMDSLRGALGPDAPPLHELMTRKISRGRSLTIVSNHPKLEWAGSIEGLFGALRVRMEGARLLRQRGNRFEFERPAAAYLIRVSNESTSPQRVEITLRGPEGSVFHEKQLTPGESWQL
jgi:hypothetical protein